MNCKDIKSPATYETVCVPSWQDVVVPNVQVIVVGLPFCKTVTAPEEEFTPAVPAVTTSVERVPGDAITVPDPTTTDVQVVVVSFGPVPYRPSVDEAVATPVQALTTW